MSRPMTQQEIKRAKQQKPDEEQLEVYNCSKQMIQLHLRQPGTDFYVGEQVVRLLPGRSYRGERKLFNEGQLDNLRAKRDIRILNN